MKLVRQFIIIMAFVFIGEFINKVLSVPVPGNILGMLLLLIALKIKLVKLEDVELFGNFLLSHLAIFFIPICVGIIAVTGALKGQLLIFTFIALSSTLIVMAVTAITVTMIKKVIK